MCVCVWILYPPACCYSVAKEKEIVSHFSMCVCVCVCMCVCMHALAVCVYMPLSVHLRIMTFAANCFVLECRM